MQHVRKPLEKVMSTLEKPRRELLLGCGNRRDKMMHSGGNSEWSGLTTLDIDERCKPDVCFDLSKLLETCNEWGYRLLPFNNDTFAELHAYEVLEHCGSQGDHRLLFAQFSEFWRVLEPGGLLFATVPDYRSLWAWGDPSHTRVINRGTLVFLSQANYVNVGSTPMSDYRDIYKADFSLKEDGYWGNEEDGRTYWFCLQAIKPSRRVP